MTEHRQHPRLTLGFLLRAALVLALAAVWTVQEAEPSDACTTDAECALQCAPDDLDCDGGPQG